MITLSPVITYPNEKVKSLNHPLFLNHFPHNFFLLILLLFISLVPSKFRLPVITLVLDIFRHARNRFILIIQKCERCLQMSNAMLLSHKWNSNKNLAKHNYKTKLKVSQTRIKIWNNHIYYFDYYFLLYNTL